MLTQRRRLRASEEQFIAIPRVDQYTSRRIRWASRSLIAIVALLFLIAIVVLAKGSGGSSHQPRYERFAELAANDWLAGRGLNVPAVSSVSGGTGSDQNGAAQPFSTITTTPTTTTTVPGSTPAVGPLAVITVGYDHYTVDRTAKGGYTETDHFVVQTAHGLFDLAVSVSDIGGNPVLAGMPSLAPTGYAAAHGPAPQPPLPWRSTSLSSGTTNQIDQWAQAYVANSPQTLYELSGDARATHYVGLGGNWKLTGQPILTGAWADKPTDTDVARVQFAITNGPQTVGVSFDLLVGDIGHRDLPPIEAWGPPGTGFGLRPWQNALQGATG